MVVNDVGNAVPVMDTSPRTPFQMQIAFALFDLSRESILFTVPTGQHAVIEQVNVEATLSLGADLSIVPFAAIKTKSYDPSLAGFNTISNRLQALTLVDDSLNRPGRSGRFYLVSQSVRWYATDGDVRVNAELTKSLTVGSGSANFVFRVSGYFVPDDSPSLAP
jgi:hypothetical protein